MNTRSILLIVLALSAGCSRSLYIQNIRQTDEIVRTYEERGDEATIVISRWGNIYRKWRVTSSAMAVLYQVDVTTQICRAGVDVVPCENVKKDGDMRRYIVW
jgi:hypothetical protein